MIFRTVSAAALANDLLSKRDFQGTNSLFHFDKESDNIGSANFNHIVQALKSQGPGPEAGLDKTVPEESRNAASKAVDSGQVG